jgi:glyoxylase-like metal-dependent hydrolase (beta-lactamase superfamily II)
MKNGYQIHDANTAPAESWPLLGQAPRWTAWMGAIVLALAAGHSQGYHRPIADCAGSAFTTRAGASDPGRSIRSDYPLDRLTPNVYVIHGPTADPTPENQAFRNNPGIVLTPEGVVVIDPGSSVHVGDMVVRKVKTLTSKPIVAVFNTHSHGDHWLGNEGIKLAYPRAVIYAHPKMKAMAIQDEGRMWIKAFNTLSAGAAEGTTPVGPHKAVNDGDVIAIGGTRFRILYPGPSHSDHDIMSEIPDEKVLFFGDIVRDGLLGPFMTSFKGNIAAIDRGLNTGAKVFIPGHGRSGDATVARNYRLFLVTLREQVRRNYRNGLSDFEMKPRIAKALTAYRDWSSLDESLGRLVSAAYQEIEAEEF